MGRLTLTLRTLARLGAVAGGCVALLVGMVGGASAGQPVLSTLGTPVSQSPTSAQLSVSVNPGGLDTTVYFQYGATTSYGSQTSAQDVGSGNLQQTFQQTLSGLTAGETYHVQAVASNTAGVAYGSEQTFIAGYPQASTEAATNVTAAGATLNGQVNPAGQATTYQFAYGTTPALGSTSPTASLDGSQGGYTQVTANVSLSPGIYYFQLQSYDTSDSSQTADGAILQVAIGQATAFTDPPTPVSGTTTTFNGRVNAGGASGTTYFFQYGTSVSYGSSTTAQSAASDYTTWPYAATVEGLTEGTTYHYRMVADNAAGPVYGADQTVVPGQPQASTASATQSSATAAVLAGDVASGGVATTYVFQYGTNLLYGQSTTAQSAGSGTQNAPVQATVTGLAPNVTYHFRIVATNATGSVYGDDGTFTLQSPFATTAAATSVTATGATLTGQVGAGGLDTTYYFQYGLTTSYGSTTAVADAGSGTDAVPVSAAVSGLVQGDTYHYQLVAQNTAGTAYGVDGTFVPGQAQAVTEAATGLSDTSESLDGSVTPDGVDTTYYYQYGTTTAYEGTPTSSQDLGAGSSAVDAPATLAGLQPGTTYHYRLVADNDTGPAVDGADATFTTPNAPTPVTSAPTGVVDRAAVLQGTVNPNGFDATVYFVWGPGSSLPQSPMFTTWQDGGSGIAAQAVTAQLSGLSPSTTYTYEIVASNGVGAPVAGAPQTFTTAATASKPLVDSEDATPTADTAATVAGAVNPQGQQTLYYLQYGATDAMTSQTATTGAGQGSADVPVSVAVSGLSAGTTYYYRLVATNGTGTTDAATQTFTTPMAPSATTGSASAIAQTSATIAGTVDPNGYVTSFVFQYGATSSYGSTSPSQLAGGGASAVAGQYTLIGLQADTTYHFRIVASNGVDTVDGQDGTFTTASAPLAPVVTATSASSLTDTSVSLGATVNPQDQDTSYYFQYGPTDTYGSTTSVGDAGSGSSGVSATRSLTGLQPGTTYHFAIVASNTTGTTRGPDQTLTTPVPPSASTTATPTGVGASTATLHASVNPNGFQTNYLFQYGPQPSLGLSTSSVSAGSGLSQQSVASSLNGLAPGTAYYFRVVATNGSDVVYGGLQTFTTAAVPPATVSTMPASSIADTTATLTGLVDPLGAAASYEFQYGTTTAYGSLTTSANAGSASILEPVSAALTGLQPGTTYHFRLVATNASGPSLGGDQTFTTTGSPPTQSGGGSGGGGTSGGSGSGGGGTSGGSGSGGGSSASGGGSSGSGGASSGSGGGSPAGGGASGASGGADGGGSSGSPSAHGAVSGLRVAIVGAAHEHLNGATGKIDTGIAVSCPAGGRPCTVSAPVTASARGAGKLASRSLTVAAGHTEQVVVKLPRSAIARLRAHGRMHATVVVRAAAPGAGSQSVSRAVALHA